MNKQIRILGAIIKLLRWPNLLIIVATMYMLRYFVIAPMLAVYGVSLQFDSFHFFLLNLSTVLITAGGYVINDYFDRKTDQLNRPNSVIIGRIIHRRFAMMLHFFLSATGVFIGSYLSFYIHIPLLSIVFFLIAGLLWFYSTSYKRQFLLGNVIVAILTALVTIMPILFEIPMLNKNLGELLRQYHVDLRYLLVSIAGYAFFAFITTLIREIIKDAEDFEGDAAYGRNSIPIVLGMKITKYIINGLLIVTILCIGVAVKKLFDSSLDQIFVFTSVAYLFIFLIIPMIYLITKVYAADSKKDFHFASMYAKTIMVLGLLYTIVIYYFLK